MMRDRKFLFLAGMIGMLFWVGCSEKIEPGAVSDNENAGVTPLKTAELSVKYITDWYEAIGTIRPRTETSIQSQVTAQVVKVHVNPGARVKKGQMLVSLDNRQFRSRLDQARQSYKAAVAGEEQARHSVAAATAALKEAESAYQRTRKYLQSQAATSQEMERAESAYLQAKAGLETAKEALAAATARIRQAQEVVNEAEIAMGYTAIKAPENGEVLKRLVEPGDLALPGKPLAILRTSGMLRLEAYVREGLIQRVKPGQHLEVSINTLNKTVDAEVEEIIPYADPQTRTFLVKASLPPMEGLYPGMFGKLLIPVEKHPAVLVPKEAVRRVGQLELVWVKRNDFWKSRHVKTGRMIDGDLEILSGLSGDETIGWGVSK